MSFFRPILLLILISFFACSDDSPAPENVPTDATLSDTSIADASIQDTAMATDSSTQSEEDSGPPECKWQPPANIPQSCSANTFRCMTACRNSECILECMRKDESADACSECFDDRAVECGYRDGCAEIIESVICCRIACDGDQECIDQQCEAMRRETQQCIPQHCANFWEPDVRKCFPTECAADETRVCHIAPDGQAGVGACRAGRQQCERGLWSECVGAIAPEAEDACGDSIDNDCDGQIDEGCGDCRPGERRSCYSGDPVTKNRGVCRGGIQTCDDRGHFPESCDGEILPQEEICHNNVDDNCDGQIDEDCPCIPQCSGKECGGDGCGGSCGSCNSNEVCAAGSCEVPQCNPVRDTLCTGNDACYPQAFSDPVCIREGTRSEGSACSFTNECRGGFACINDECQEVCRRSFGNADCDRGETCTSISGWGQYGGCVANQSPGSCDPIRDSGCGFGEGCFVVSGEATTCAPDGSGRSGSSCSTSNECAGGYGCFGTCRRFCRVANGNSDCGFGETCQGVRGWSTYGACN